MPPRTTLPTALRAWQCPSCKARTFVSTSRRQVVGPEHPRYVDIPETPQQTLPNRPPVKGTLPVPRDIFAGALGTDRAAEARIRRAAPAPTRQRMVAPGSRDEWKAKMAEARRRNLEEGLQGLRSRKWANDAAAEEKRYRRWDEAFERFNRPEREDERLTTPSHGLDLETLMNSPLQDPNRKERVARMKANVAREEMEKQADRLDSIHTLYMHARTFIVTPEQLNEAIDDAFGTVESPRAYEDYSGEQSSSIGYRGQSVWAQGYPMTVQNMLSQATRAEGTKALDNASGFGEINKERIRRIAEGLTGGKMAD